ncbi:F0F1 ATP synthase subunit A [Hazenella coriacea]|uniref:ATP synthase subunit a n=1 Tax=Hazenella coriacea TaxID=1179467 RepID=A0A4R3L921_9BACL|nr:F0F1 ATP synthase subunit A [Hazenella coriacea]TCS95590.1 F-type H+-transporting ATPase subunit a [Hazenella coriacea]
METTPKVDFLGMTFDLTVVGASLIAAIIVFVFVMWATRRREMVPRGVQTVMEMVIDFANSITKLAYDDKRAPKFLAFTLTLFLFILVANQMGVIGMVTATVTEPIPALGLEKDDHISLLKSPTADMNFAFAFAIAIALFANFMGIITSFKNYVKHFINPLGIIHVIEEFSKPLTHALRIWANIFAGEILITVLLTKMNLAFSGLPLVVWIGFSLFVGLIQAYIFTVLANVYIAQKISTDH